MAQSIVEKKDRSLNELAADMRKSMKAKGIEYMENHKGQEVPLEYVPPADILCDYYCSEIIEEAKALERQIAEFKFRNQQVGDLMYKILMGEDRIRDDSKGGFTMGRFDKSAKIEYKMDTVETVDKLMLEKAYANKERYVDELKEMLDGKIPEEEMYVVDLMNEAFEQNNGQIDPRRRSMLNKYRDRIKNAHFQKFLQCYNDAFDLQHTKRYETFAERDDQNQFDSIILHYPKIDPENPAQ